LAIYLFIILKSFEFGPFFFAWQILCIHSKSYPSGQNLVKICQ
jgi:hypothetical protein